MKVKALAPWYGSNRLLGEHVGRLLSSCNWVGVPFAGGMCELPYIRCASGIANDLHKHVINLAGILGNRKLGPILYRRLRRWPFHSDSLAHAQARCRDIEQIAQDMLSSEDLLEWAENYFACAWMARNGTAGSQREFSASFSVRWSGSGGDSALRYQQAVKSLVEWRRVLRCWTFLSMDAFDFLRKCKDLPKNGIYADPPFPDGPGDLYQHSMAKEQHQSLAAILRKFRKARVVCRFYDSALVRRLYPKTHWEWHYIAGGRKCTNATAPEILLTNTSSLRDNHAENYRATEDSMSPFDD